METRREFLAATSRLGAFAVLLPGCATQESNVSQTAPEEAQRLPLFRISLAQWSLHRALRSGELEHLDFARTAREEYGIGAVEYVNSFFKDRARDEAYLAEMVRRADGEGVQSLLIMVDGEGSLGDADDLARATAVENHHRWIDAAVALGCHSIRVNAAGAGERGEVAKRSADSLVALADYAGPHGTNVIVENHGGLSSDGAWLGGVMRLADHPRVGTLPDFGNFRLAGDEWYDRYLGVEELMPFAKAVSAKSHAFDAEGNETTTDYVRMMKIVVDSGYRGWVGVEYEGSAHSEHEGIRLTQALLERVRNELS